jgi:hypothetical protein
MPFVEIHQILVSEVDLFAEYSEMRLVACQMVSLQWLEPSVSSGFSDEAFCGV